MAALACAFCLLSGLASQTAEAAPTFGAYYTKINQGQEWEAFSRTGKYADVVVRLPVGKLIFSRGTSYLPYWVTSKGQWSLPEIVQRSGDGVEPMPDRNNVYSHVEVVKNTPSQVIIHWRYLSSFTPGNPHGKVALDHFVDELFSITPEGNITRVIRQCADRIDDWNDPLNRTIQVLQLNAEGIVEISKTAASHSAAPRQAFAGLPQKLPVTPPSLWFRFDEGAGPTTTEEVTRAVLSVSGPKVLWKKGVSGTALEFDGYHSAVVLPAAEAPKIAGGSVTLEGWIALGAFPWNWAPVIQQGDNKGYFLGVDSHGYPGFMVEVSGTWQQLTVPSKPPYTDPNHLAVFRWYQLAGTYNQHDGMMRLFVNGREIANKLAGPGGVQTTNADVRVGKAGIMRKPTEDTHGSKPSDFGIDGLLDEVRVYNTALNASQVSTSFATFNPASSVVSAPDMQKRRFPSIDTGGKFSAYCTHLPYYETWDNLWCVGDYSDLVVGFDETPMKYVFWRGMSYIPMMVNDAHQWYTNEFNETGFNNKYAPGDCEPMSDKACLDSHVRLIEDNPARKVIHWRYRLANPDHHWASYDANTGWGDIADWYFYIYPDGVTCKLMRCYSSKPNLWHEWDEQIVVFGEGQHPESVIKKTPVMTLVDAKGTAVDYDWNPNPPKPKYPGSVIQMIHLTGEYSPFSIQNFNNGDIYGGERTWYSVFPSWNHWPTSQIDSSGRNASFPDRAAHSSISHYFLPNGLQETGSAPFQEKVLLEGMSNQSPASLISLARSWLHAPSVTNLSGAGSQGYIQNERAYAFQYSGTPFGFTLDATTDEPIHNLCFEIKHWPSRNAAAGLKINQVPQVAGPNFRQGVNIDTDGSYTLIVWVGLSSTSAQTIQLSER